MKKIVVIIDEHGREHPEPPCPDWVAEDRKLKLLGKKTVKVPFGFPDMFEIKIKDVVVRDAA